MSAKKTEKEASFLFKNVKNHCILEDPYEKTGIREHIFHVRVSDLDQKLTQHMKTNPRVQNGKGHVASAVQGSLNSNDHLFPYKSNGILFSAKGIYPKTAETTAHDITITLENDSMIYGNIDGGGLLVNCVNSNGTNDPKHEQFVKITVLEKVPNTEALALIAQARNTSIAVSNTTIADYRGAFDLITEILSGCTYSNNIKYRQYKPGKIKIEKILALLLAFDESSSHRIRYADICRQGKIVLSSYLRAGGAANKKKNMDLLNDETMKQKRIDLVESMRDILPQIIELHDDISVWLADYNKDAFRSNLRCLFLPVADITNPSISESLFLEKEVGYKVSDLLTFMMTTAFVCAVGEKNECSRYQWKPGVDPKRLLEAGAGEKLITMIVKEMGYSFSNPTKIASEDILSLRDSDGIWGKMKEEVASLL
jgi:hypothetical protein